MSFWGAAALICVAAAVVSATISAAFPGATLAGLHSNRTIDSSGDSRPDDSAAVVADLKTAQAQLAGLEGSEAGLRTANAELETRLATALADTHRLSERVGALEASLPRLADAISARPAPIDSTIITGSIDAPASGFSHSQPDREAVAAETLPPRLAPPTNWAATYMTSPASRRIAVLSAPPPGPVPLATASRPDPIVEAAIAPEPAASPTNSSPAAAPVTNPATPSPSNVRSIGVAVGAPVTVPGALAAWQGLAAKIGVLLVGTSPLLADDPSGSDGKVLVAGPLPDIAAAAKLCSDVDHAGITCTPMPYVGSPLQPAATN